MKEELKSMLIGARQASRQLNRMQEADINRLLLHAADKVDAETAAILEANANDLSRMDSANPNTTG